MRAGLAFPTLAACLLAYSLRVHGQQQQACNGYPELCSKPYSAALTVGAHDSFAVSVTSSNVAANQAFNVTTQLRNGVRLLQGQGHMNNNTIHLCHTACILYDGGTLTSYMSEVKSFLDDNPNEVITLLWVNTDSIPVSTWAQSYEDSGLVNYVYTPPTVPVNYTAWPTLSQLISLGTRVVSFIASGADYSSSTYLLDEFTHIWETPFDQTDASFPCTVDRPADKDTTGKMYLLNRFLDANTTIFGIQTVTPDLASIDTTNSVSAIEANVQSCVAQHDQLPTFILFDYYDRDNGSVFEAAASLSNLTYIPRLVGNASLSSTDLAAQETSAGWSQAQIPGFLVTGVACILIFSFA